MNPERWKKIEEIFQPALDLSGDEREAFVRTQCGEDADLCREVEKHIARFETEDTFLESPVWTDSRFLKSEFKKEIDSSLENVENDSSAPFINRQIGVYRLVRELGRGGMGIVYLGERADGEFSQKVAIKLIKRGMDTDFIVKRFRRERQIVATLDHPNIARLFDGGTTSDGLPYFVLEYIEGKAIFKYAEEKNLDLRSKLELFVQICAAISYAHGKKIIHRDIKPGNILIGEGSVPKLLDFGIAKILDPELIHESVLPTETQMRLMTPEYASPEQVRGEEVTAASDQYSLGVLLYELLTGNRPYKFPSRALHEIARIICEEMPSEPSSGAAYALIDEAGDVLSGEESYRKLDRIVLKTLRKNPVERYASVEDFARDIERFLRGETILAEKVSDVAKKIEAAPAGQKTNPGGGAQTAAEGIVPQKDEAAVAHQRKIKQGLFLIVTAFFLLPLLVLNLEMLEPEVLIFLFLLIFLGGIVRIVHAQLFAPRRAAPPAAEPEKSLNADVDPTRLFSAAQRLMTHGNKRQTAEEFAAPDGKTIAVLPFKNLSALTGDNTDVDDFLSIGLADALISRLSGVGQLIVRPTGSILKFGGEDTDEFAAGDELKVQFLLVGNILRVEGKIRVSVQLLDAKNRRAIWAQRFTENLTDVLTLEDKISEQVAELLIPQLTLNERGKLAKRGTDTPQAYEAYLRGRFYWNSLTEDGFSKAFVAYQEAISHDPEYALAYAGIADYYIWLGVYGVLPPQECYPPAKDAARRAVELDEELAEAYASLGFAQLCGDFDRIEAEKNLVRAIEINPHYAVARLWYSYILQTARRHEEGIEQAKRAVALDPLTYTNHHVLSWAYYFARRFDDANRQISETVKKFPNVGLAYFTQSWFLRLQGDYEAALKTSQRALELSGDSLFVLLGHAQALAAAGEKSATKQVLERIFKHGKNQYLSFYQVALIYLYGGEIEKSLDALEKAYEQREGWLIWLRAEPALDKLRGETRFVNLQKKVVRQTAQIDASGKSKSHSDAKMPVVEKSSAAILPFRIIGANVGDSGEGAFLSIGLADSVITRLSKIKSLVVRPTGSIMRFADGQIDPFAAGRELTVDYVLDGNLRLVGERVRISAQLLKVSERATIWAEKFDEKFTDVLELEDAVAEKVASLLAPRLSVDERRRLDQRGTNNAAAYELYLRGRVQWNLFTPDALQKSIAYFQRAVTIDPQYALAYASMAECHYWLGAFIVGVPREHFGEARRHARRAIELDDTLGEAFSILGFVSLFDGLPFKWREAEELCRRGLELNPNYAWGYIWFSAMLASAGRFDESIEAARRGLELDPLSPVNQQHLGFVLYQARRFDEAAQQFEKTIADSPDFGFARGTYGWMLRAAGQLEESLAQTRRAVEQNPGTSLALCGLAATLYQIGRVEESLELVREIESQMSEQHFSAFHLAVMYAVIGDHRRAFEQFETAITDNDGWVIWLSIDPQLDILRRDARYQDWLRRTGNPLAR